MYIRTIVKGKFSYITHVFSFKLLSKIIFSGIMMKNMKTYVIWKTLLEGGEDEDVQTCNMEHHQSQAGLRKVNV